MTSLHLTVEAPDDDLETVAGLTDQLYTDLRHLDEVDVHRPDAPTRPGSKSGAGYLLDQLIVTGTAGTALTLTYRTITAFLDRAKARSVKIKANGKEVVITAASTKDVKEAMRLLDEDTPE